MLSQKHEYGALCVLASGCFEMGNMALENKLGINDLAELARVEEKIGKTKAIKLYESNIVEDFEVGKFSGLAKIDKFLFEELYDFAGKVRIVNIAKGNFRFAPVMYLDVALKHIGEMPQSTFGEIIEKYVEMNVAHPFREGNVIQRHLQKAA